MKELIFISPGKDKPNIDGNFKTRLIYIDWKYKTITDLVDEVMPKIKGDIIAGYSIGGTVALILTQRLKLKKLILYSPSPLFKEKVNTLSNPALVVLGKRRLADAKTYSIKEIINDIKFPVEIYIGSKETKVMTDFAKYLNKRLENSSLITKEGRSHNDLLI